MLEALLEWLGWIASRTSSFVTRKPSRIVSFKLWTLGNKSSLFFLDFLELVVWNRKEVTGINGFDLRYCGGTLTVLYVGCWQSVGCQRTFPRLVAYFVVILLKSPQKGALALGADAWGSWMKKTRGFWSVLRMTFLANTYCWLRSIPRTGERKLLLDLWVHPLCHRERSTYRSFSRDVTELISAMLMHI